jgi:hypothetical protein
MAEVLDKIPTLNMRAAFQPGTVNEEKRTVDVCFGTDAPVLMHYFDSYYEILNFNTSSVRLERLNSGAPLQDGHYGDQIGVVEKAWTDGKKGYATVRFSKNPAADEIFKDVIDGIKRNISIGYSVYAYTEREGGTDKVSTYEATDWEPYEISIVKVPADYKAGVRSADDVKNQRLNDVKILKLNRSMEETPEQKTAREASERAAAAEATRTAAEAAERARLASENKTPEQIDAAIQSERKRSSDILSSVRSAKLPVEFAEKLILDPTMTVEAARGKIIEEFTKGDKGGNGSVVVTGEDEKDKFRAAMTEALTHRVDPKTKLERGKEFAHLRLMDMAKIAAERTGANIRGMSPREIVGIALNLERGGAGMMSSSDFPNILAAVVNKSLRSAYELQKRTFLPFCRQENAADFKSKHKIQIGDLVDSFDEIKEGGEYKYSKVGEAKESYVVKKYGKIISISWESIINDDLGAFNRIPQAIAAKAAQKQSDIVWGIITGNPNMADGVALFEAATHKNLAGSGAAVSLTTLDAAFQAMTNQKSLGGDFINISPSFILLPPAIALVASQYLSANYVPTTQGNIMPEYLKGLQPIIEPRLGVASATAWFLAAAPAMVDTIEFAFLEGEGELFTESRTGWDVDGMEMKARMVFGAGAIDYRGFYKNAGA